MFSSYRTQPTQYCGVTISREWSERLAPPRCQSVPLVIASDPDGIIILIVSARSLVSRSAARLLKSAGFTAPAMVSNPRGVNRLVISPLCRTLIVGMAGRYHLVKEEDGSCVRQKTDTPTYATACSMDACRSVKAAAWQASSSPVN
jgi:hypothetical protein